MSALTISVTVNIVLLVAIAAYFVYRGAVKLFDDVSFWDLHD